MSARASWACAGWPGAALACGPTGAPDTGLAAAPWEFTIAPYAWAVSLKGHSTVKGIKADVDVSFDELLRHLNGAIMLEAEMRIGPIGLLLGTIYANICDKEQSRRARVKVQSDANQLIQGFAGQRHLDAPSLINGSDNLLTRQWESTMFTDGTQFRHLAGATLIAGALLANVAPAWAAEPISEQDAQAIGIDAYIYFYPLITMGLTRRQLTNGGPAATSLQKPMNSFANIGAYPTADMKVVVRPNFDTLYSSAWLDLAKEPTVISVPDTEGRYYLLPMLDMWTDVFASPGWRTTGTGAAKFLITPPGWTGAAPDGVSRIEAPTRHVWIIGRIKTDGPSDYAAVNQIQGGWQVTPLSQWGKPAQPVTATFDPSVDMKTPPKLQVDAMPAAQYFAYVAEIMKLQPPHRNHPVSAAGSAVHAAARA